MSAHSKLQFSLLLITCIDDQRTPVPNQIERFVQVFCVFMAVKIIVVMGGRRVQAWFLILKFVIFNQESRFS